MSEKENPPDEGDVVRLREMRPGTRGTIVRLSCGGKLKHRLMDMGVVAGTPVELVRFAPMGDPIELKIMGFNLSLRGEEAGDIWVRLKDGADVDAPPRRRLHRLRRRAGGSR